MFISSGTFSQAPFSCFLRQRHWEPPSPSRRQQQGRGLSWGSCRTGTGKKRHFGFFLSTEQLSHVLLLKRRSSPLQEFRLKLSNKGLKTKMRNKVVNTVCSHLQLRAHPAISHCG